MNCHFSKLINALAASACLIFVYLPATAATDLTNRQWLVSGTDTRGVSWNGSTLNFQTQTPSGNAFTVTGYFFWTSTVGEFGRENFNGVLGANNRISLDGFQIVAPASGIVIGHYEADLTADGTRLINGTWSGSTIPGVWSAVAVPEVSTWAMLLAGSAIVVVATRRRKDA